MHLFINRTIIFLFCVLCLSVRPASCLADTDRTITQAQWKQLTTDKAFSYKDEHQKLRPTIKKESKPNPFLKFFTAIGAFFSAIGGFAMWLLIIGIVAFVIYVIVVNSESGFIFGKGKRKMKESGLPDQTDEDISGTNWEQLLQHALNHNDMRLAVRYSYMWLLQILQQHELISYRIDKTNFEYYSELDGTAFKGPFKQLSRQYEYTWYGHYNQTRSGYDEFSTLFHNIKNELGA